MSGEKNTKKKSFLQKISHKLNNIHIGIGKERDYFIENLSMLVASGMPIVSGISVLEQGVRTKTMKRILRVFKEDIEGGSMLWKAFAKTGIFRDHTVSLVRIGEESGRLAENLKLIASQETKDRSFRSKIRSAMMYPVFVLTLTVVIGVAIAWFILPRLATVFDQLRIELPTLTRVLINTGTFLGEYGVYVVPAFFFFLGCVLFFTFSFSKTKFIGQAILFRIPGIKRLLQEVELARFGYILGTLLEAGLPVTRALDSLYNAAQFPNYKKFYAHLRDSIDDGNSFKKSFDLYKNTDKLVPPPIQQLIVAGEQSGNLSETLFNISVNYEAKTENTTKNLAVILEPILLVIVWLGVVSVALGVILPIYNLIGGLSVGPGQSPASAPAPQETSLQPTAQPPAAAAATPSATTSATTSTPTTATSSSAITATTSDLTLLSILAAEQSGTSTGTSSESEVTSLNNETE